MITNAAFCDACGRVEKMRPDQDIVFPDGWIQVDTRNTGPSLASGRHRSNHVCSHKCLLAWSEKQWRPEEK